MPSQSQLVLSLAAPATAPVIKGIQSSSPNTVEVSWSPPLFPNGLVVGYNLLLTSENHKLLRASRGHSFQFYSTLPNHTYRYEKKRHWPRPRVLWHFLPDRTGCAQTPLGSDYSVYFCSCHRQSSLPWDNGVIPDELAAYLEVRWRGRKSNLI